MAQYVMVIDLQKCVGCGACALACKTENNTQNRRNRQAFNWADFKHEMEGKFPDVRYKTIPVLCNHCSNPACIPVCPVKPKAMFKTPEGITMHNDERCIGCRACQEACPYSKLEVEGNETSTISFNGFSERTHHSYRNSETLIKDCTSSGIDTARAARGYPPHRTKYDHPEYYDVRRPGVVEKCIFCDHRVKTGKLPYCVESCPSGARVFGDLQDENSEVYRLLKGKEHFVLKPEEGTKPNVYYIGNFSTS